MAQTKSTITKADLPKDVFGLKVEDTKLLTEAVRAFRANQRKVSAKTLTRGLVSGGGRKPWRQKGTGKARAGSIRSPIWRGGGVVFGPLGIENYQIKLSKKSRRLAIKQALSLKADAGLVEQIADIKLASHKTKELNAKLIKHMGQRTLLISDDTDINLKRAAKNLPRVNLAAPKKLNVYDVLAADKILLTQAAKTDIINWLSDAKKTTGDK